MNIGIYKITSPSGKVYIGQSNNIELRFSFYKSLRCKKQIKIYRSLLKYGYESHKFEVIELCNLDQLNVRERYWQEFYNSMKGGLNCSLVGTSDKKFVHSDESRNKISNARTGMKFSDEHIQNIVKCRTGTFLTQSTKDKLSEISKRITSKSMLSRPLPYSDIVLDIESGVYYYSMRDLSRHHSLGKTAIIKRLKKGNLKGYILC